MWVLQFQQNVALEFDLSVVNGPADSVPTADVIMDATLPNHNFPFLNCYSYKSVSMTDYLLIVLNLPLKLLLIKFLSFLFCFSSLEGNDWDVWSITVTSARYWLEHGKSASRCCNPNQSQNLYEHDFVLLYFVLVHNSNLSRFLCVNYHISLVCSVTLQWPLHEKYRPEPSHN